MKIMFTKKLTLVMCGESTATLLMDGNTVNLLVGDSVTVEWPAISIDNHPDIKVSP